MPFADQDLARRVEGGWVCLGVENAQALAQIDPTSGATALPVGGGYAIFMGAGSPLSQVIGLGLHGPVAESELEQVESLYRDRNAPIQLELSSLADPTLLGLLSSRGYHPAEQTHVLVRPIGPGETDGRKGATRSSDWDDETGGDIAVAPIRPDEVETWAEAVLRCFFPGPEDLPGRLKEGAIAMATLAIVSGWLARADGRIAGGGALAVCNGLALICGDGTLPEFRNRGVQAALLRARLERARAVGCDLAVICTQPGSRSQRNAERQGFQVVYARTLMTRD